MVKKAIADLDSSKASGLNYIPVVVLKNLETELWYILADLFRSFIFLNCWKVLHVIFVFKNLCERSVAKNYHPMIVPSIAWKIFEKVVNKSCWLTQKFGLFLISIISSWPLFQF